MKILFMSLVKIKDFNERNIYSDLLREFVRNGHYVRVVSPITGEATCDIRQDGYSILQVETSPIQKVNFIKKGLATLQIAPRIKSALKKHCADEKYDLVLIATPPITLVGVVSYVKKRDDAEVYLLLKDIWPQGIADLGAISETGLVYRFFRRKEKKLYALSDHIGCMSQANVDYVLKHNPEISPNRVEICPNAIEVQDISISEEERMALRVKHGIPLDKRVFVYGGNLGKPQGIPFLIKCLQSQETNAESFFLIVGNGTEYGKLEAYFNNSKLQNMKLMRHIPKEDYDLLIAACDVGMIFLDHRFTIPNFPSRLLGYMQAKLPVLAVTDPNTDIGKVIEAGGFGWWCESNDIQGFSNLIYEINKDSLIQKGESAYNYLKDNYAAHIAGKIVLGSKMSAWEGK